MSDPRPSAAASPLIRISLLVLATMFGMAGVCAAEPALAGDDEAARSADVDTAGEVEPAPEGEPHSGACCDAEEAAASEAAAVRIEAACSSCSSINLTVNGLSQERIGLSFDGIPVAGGLGAVYSLTQFPAEFVGATAVIRGPGSVLTGTRGIAGSIELSSTGRLERKSLLQAEVGGRGWRQLRAAATDRWGPVGALVFVQGALQDADSANGDPYNESAAIERFTYEGIVDLHLSERQVLTLGAGFQGEDQHDGPGGPYSHVISTQPAVSEWRYYNADAFYNQRTFTGSWTHDLRGGGRLEAKGRYSRRGHQYWNFISQTEFEDGQKRNTYTIEDELSHARFTAELPTSSSGFLTAGIGWNKQRLWVAQTYGQPFWIVDGLEAREAFLQHEQVLSPKWSYVAGVRYDAFTVFGRTKAVVGWGSDARVVDATDADLDYAFLSPRGELTLRASRRWTLSWALGRGILPPEPSFAERCCSAKYQRNRTLRPERSWSTQLRAEWVPSSSSRLCVAAWWTDFSDYHEEVVYAASAYIPQYSVRALPKARVRGFDIVHDLSLRGGRFSLGWTYAFTDSEILEPYHLVDEETGEPVLQDGSPVLLDEAGRELRYTPRHAASAYFRFNDTKRGIAADFDAKFTGGMDHFRIDDAVQAADPWGFNRSEAFWTFDARYEQRIGNSGWSGYAGVDNLTDYVMPDLGDHTSAYEWGPVQGRFVYVGAKFVR